RGKQYRFHASEQRPSRRRAGRHSHQYKAGARQSKYAEGAEDGVAGAVADERDELLEIAGPLEERPAARMQHKEAVEHGAEPGGAGEDVNHGEQGRNKSHGIAPEQRKAGVSLVNRSDGESLTGRGLFLRPLHWLRLEFVRGPAAGVLAAAALQP